MLSRRLSSRFSREASRGGFCVRFLCCCFTGGFLCSTRLCGRRRSTIWSAVFLPRTCGTRSSRTIEELLAKELYGDDDKGKLQMVRTHDKHLPFKKFERADARVERDDTTVMRVDNNNVDIDMEMASLAKNQLWYSAMTRSLGGYISRVKSVMQNGEG